MYATPNRKHLDQNTCPNGRSGLCKDDMVAASERPSKQTSVH